MTLNGGEPPFESPDGDDNVVPFTITLAEAKRREARKQGPKGLVAREWLELKLPPRDYLLGSVLCTTSRWLIYGDTGIGKTLFTMMLAGGVAAGDAFLNWPGTMSKRRVLYLDGEMPAETFQERIKLVTAIYGEEIELYGFNREIENWPPLNDQSGRQWLAALLHIYAPDLIVFDSIMSLVGGIMLEEESWAPMRTIVRWLSQRQVAQIWVHHTGHDGGHSYGTKTREWEMDTVLGLHRSKDEDEGDEETRVELDFQKARLRTPHTFAQFKSCTATFDGEAEIWRVDGSRPVVKPKATPGKRGEDLVRELIRAYGQICDDDNIPVTQGHDGAPVRKVALRRLQVFLMKCGALDHESGKLSAAERGAFFRAKDALRKSGKFTEDDGQLWRIRE